MNPPSNSSQRAVSGLHIQSLSIVDGSRPHLFAKPVKKINEGHHVPQFLTSKGYGDIGVFVMQLNRSMCPRKLSSSNQAAKWQLDTPLTLSEPVSRLQEMLRKIDTIIEEAPPDAGPRRFGNVSFRKWLEILESRVAELLQHHLPTNVVAFAAADNVQAIDELAPYLLGAFGSSQRLDYGTGHELSFLAFLGCIWKLGGFSCDPPQDGTLERSIVIGVIEPYLRIVRRLILTYTLEPAGSHGVWGLDDHSFLPYIFGSSQYCPMITESEAMPLEGSLPDSPLPGDITKKNIVDRERKYNMYFSAIGFINDVKTGAFWEHSPILFDISGVRSGWGKINKGMIKMYNAEVLAKFPVVQHFPFGSLFSWDQDPDAHPVESSVHTSNQPVSGPPQSQESTRAPWAASSSGAMMPPTAAPWAKTGTRAPVSTTRAPWAAPPTSLPSRDPASRVVDGQPKNADNDG